jgi:hypothetical protein
MANPHGNSLFSIVVDFIFPQHEPVSGKNKYLIEKQVGKTNRSLLQNMYKDGDR